MATSLLSSLGVTDPKTPTGVVEKRRGAGSSSVPMAGSIASEASSYAGKSNYKIISLACTLHVPILPTLDQGFSDRFYVYRYPRQCSVGSMAQHATIESEHVDNAHRVFVPSVMTEQRNRSINDTRRIVRGRRIAPSSGLVLITITSTVRRGGLSTSTTGPERMH
jgi:hypothetical protein